MKLNIINDHLITLFLVHLWRYNNGFNGVTATNKILGEQEWYHEMTKERSKMLLQRNNQMLYEFSFWNDVVPRDGPNIYELREYKLKVCLPFNLCTLPFSRRKHLKSG